MKVGVMKWPGGRWIAHRSQQGKVGKHVTLGPIQVNWHDGLRLYVTWPTAFCVYGYRRGNVGGCPIPKGLREGP